MGGVLAKIVFKSGEERLDETRDLQHIEMLDIDGNTVSIGDLMADKKVILFVNVATK